MEIKRLCEKRVFINLLGLLKLVIEIIYEWIVIFMWVIEILSLILLIVMWFVISFGK